MGPYIVVFVKKKFTQTISTVVSAAESYNGN